MEELRPVQPTPKKRPNIVLRLLAFLLTLALALGAVALVAFRDKINFDSLKRYFTYRSLEMSDSGQPESFQLDSGGKGGCAGLGDDLLVYSSSGAKLFSVGGVDYLDESILLNKPVADLNGSSAVVYDAGGYALRVIRDRESALELNMAPGHELLSARLNASGRLILTTREPSYKGAVTVYDSHDQPLVSILLSSRFPMDALLSDDGKTVAVLTVGQAEDVFNSELSLYRVEEDEPFATCSLGSSVILDAKLEGDVCWTLGDGALSVVKSDGTSSGVYDYTDRYLKGYSLGGDQTAALLLGKYRAGSGATLTTVDAAGQEIASLDLDDQVLDLDAAGRYVAVLAAGRLDIYTRDLDLYASLENTGGARNVVLRSDGTAYLVTGETARLYIPE